MKNPEENIVLQKTKAFALRCIKLYKYMVDETEIPVANLSEMILEQSKINTDGLLIMTQENATHGAVVKLMDEARNSGVTNISITEY